MVPHIYELRLWLDSDAEALIEAVPTGAGHAEGTLVQEVETVRHRASKTGRNDPCPCGSGRKFKKCCGRGR